MFFIHFFSTLHSSELHMEVEDDFLKKHKAQFLLDAPTNSLLSAQNSLFGADHVTISQRKMYNSMDLPNECKDKSFEFSPKKREQAIEANLYIAKNTLDLWIKWKYFQRAQALSEVSKSSKIDVWH